MRKGAQNKWETVANEKRVRKRVVHITERTEQMMTEPERCVLRLLQTATNPVTAEQLAGRFQHTVTVKMVGDVLYGDSDTHRVLCNYVERVGGMPRRWRLKRVY